MKKCNFGGHWGRADWCRHSLLCKKACPHSPNMNLWSLLVISIWLMYQNKPICADLTPEVRGLFWGGAGGGGGVLWAQTTSFLFPPQTNMNWATGFFLSPEWTKDRQKKGLSRTSSMGKNFYLSICGSFQTGGTLFPFVAGANRLCEEAAKRRVNASKIK